MDQHLAFVIKNALTIDYLCQIHPYPPTTAAETAMLRLTTSITVLMLGLLLPLLPMQALHAAWVDAPPQVIFTEGFEKGMEGWRRQGDAAFQDGTEQSHHGSHAACITVSSKPSWLHLMHPIDEDTKPGDDYLATAWVRTSGVVTGAFLALEFYDGSKRIAIPSSMAVGDVMAKEWVKLEVRGRTPPGAKRVTLSLLLNGNGSAWFDDVEVLRTRSHPVPERPDGVVSLLLAPGMVIHPRFGGVGFHCSEHEHAPSREFREQVLEKRWRELRPSFARLSDFQNWDRKLRDMQADYMLMMKKTGTTVYLTTWNPIETPEGPERRAYAKKVVDYLEYLIRTKGCTNLQYYRMTNELSMNGWGRLADDLTRFRSYHQHLFDELRTRTLPISLLATDASPANLWPTIEWATRNMDGITGIYGGHHYINDYSLEDPTFYRWLLEKTPLGSGPSSVPEQGFHHW